MKQLADILGVAESTVSNWENENREPDINTLNKMAEYFNVSVDFLIGREFEISIPVKKWHYTLQEDYAKAKDFDKIFMEYKHGGAFFPSDAQKMPPDIKGAININELDIYPIPVLGRVVAGVPIESQENLEGYVYINHQPKEEYFALKVFGDSMINAGIPDGAVLIVHKQSTAENGDIVIAFLNDEQTVKYFKVMGEDIYLVPANNQYLPIPVRKNDNFMILGKVVEIRVSL